MQPTILYDTMAPTAGGAPARDVPALVQLHVLRVLLLALAPGLLNCDTSNVQPRRARAFRR